MRPAKHKTAKLIQGAVELGTQCLYDSLDNITHKANAAEHCEETQ